MADALRNPVANRFLNEQLRPLCEKVRDLKVRGAVTLLSWGDIARDIPNDGTLIEDDRGEEGVSRLTGADVHAAMGLLQMLNDGIPNDALPVINKPCVRSPLE